MSIMLDPTQTPLSWASNIFTSIANLTIFEETVWALYKTSTIKHWLIDCSTFFIQASTLLGKEHLIFFLLKFKSGNECFLSIFFANHFMIQVIYVA